MKNVFFITLFIFSYLHANGQDYMQQANACFDRGDYECAKKNYTLFQMLDGRDMSVQIQKAEDCLRIRNLADDYFIDKEFEKARDKYKLVLDKNSQDPKAKKQYDLCMTQLNHSISNNIITQNSSTNNSFANYTETTNNLNIEMVAVQGGTFTMGCTLESDKDCDKYATPAHKVTVNDFYIGKYEVTQAQWKAIMGSNPSYNKGDNLPVDKVSWNDVQEFTRKLNAQTGKQYRLPTEAEWEFASRGGNKSQHYIYSGSNNANDVAWYNDNSSGTIHVVGTKMPNELNIFDMSGNVSEWCNDFYDSYSSNAQINPQGPSSGSYRVLRGGGLGYGVWNVHVFNRNPIGGSDVFNEYWGFRLACNAPNRTSEINYIPNVVFFRLNSDKIDPNQHISINNTAEFMKDTGSKIKVTGYTSKDEGTDDEKLNLVKRRVQNVVSELVNKYKISPDKIISELKGSKEPPYPQNNWNRVVIMSAMK